jgi:hypothetical protein
MLQLCRSACTCAAPTPTCVARSSAGWTARPAPSSSNAAPACCARSTSPISRTRSPTPAAPPRFRTADQGQDAAAGHHGPAASGLTVLRRRDRPSRPPPRPNTPGPLSGDHSPPIGQALVQMQKLNGVAGDGPEPPSGPEPSRAAHERPSALLGPLHVPGRFQTAHTTGSTERPSPRSWGDRACCPARTCPDDTPRTGPFQMDASRYSCR